MGEAVKVDEAFEFLGLEVLGSCFTEEDALAFMILMHTHFIELEAMPFDDAPGVSNIHALTQRSAAEVLAKIWHDRTDLERTVYMYWYFKYTTEAPFEVVEDVSEDWKWRLERLLSVLRRHPNVRLVEAED